MSDKEIAEIAACYLKDKHPGGATLEVLTQGVRHEQDWWYVPVRPSFEPPRQYEYYEAVQNLLASRDVTVLYEGWEPEAEIASTPLEDTL